MSDNAGPEFWEAMARSSEKCADYFRDGAKRCTILKDLYKQDERRTRERAEQRRRTASAMRGVRPPDSQR